MVEGLICNYFRCFHNSFALLFLFVLLLILRNYYLRYLTFYLFLTAFANILFFIYLLKISEDDWQNLWKFLEDLNFSEVKQL